MEQIFLNAKSFNTITIGATNSGKSYLALCYIRYALKHNLYGEYHIIAPHMKDEQNKSYDFLKQHKDKVFYYTKFAYDILDYVEKRKQNNTVFFLIDDATGMIANDNFQTELLRLFSTHRHKKQITNIIICHSSKNLKKSLRALCHFIFITQIYNEPLLKDIYTDFLSMIYTDKNKTYKDFLSEYSQCRKEEYFQMVIGELKMILKLIVMLINGIF